MSEAERMALYKAEKSVMGDNELPGLFYVSFAVYPGTGSGSGNFRYGEHQPA